MTLIDGCYNANPMSMRAALEDLVQTAGRASDGRLVAVLGDMRELGPGARGYHVELGRQVARAGVGLLVTVGPLAQAIANLSAARSTPYPTRGLRPNWFRGWSAPATWYWSRGRSRSASSGFAGR